MDHHAQSVDDALIGGLSYKLKAGASYVTSHLSVSYFAQGSNQYSSNCVKIMKFNLTGDQWLDPNTFRTMLQLNNEDHDAASSVFVQPLSWNPARCRLIAGGQIIEDIDNLNKLSLMLTALKSEDEQLGIASEGFGSFDAKYGSQAADPRKTYRLDDHDRSGIVAAGRKVMFKPLACIFNQAKLLPPRYCPIEVELGLVNDGADAVFVDMATAGGKYTANWDISDIQCKCDLLTLSSSLDNEYAFHLLPGKALPINFPTWNQTNQSTGNNKNLRPHINRSLTRPKIIFISLGNSDPAREKEVNIFYHPVASSTSDQYALNDEHQVLLPTGSKLVPEYPITSVTEALYQLKKRLVLHSKCMQGGTVLVNTLLDLIWIKLVEPVLLV